MELDAGPEAEEEAHEEAEPAEQPWRGPQIKLNKFGGFRSEYRRWCDEVQAMLKLHSVLEEKQVLLLYLALEAGKSRPCDFFPAYLVDEVAAHATTDIWKRLNEEYEEEKYIEADEALADYEKCRRNPGQSMRDYLMTLRLARLRMQLEDPGSVSAIRVIPGVFFAVRD